MYPFFQNTFPHIFQKKKYTPLQKGVYLFHYSVLIAVNALNSMARCAGK